MRSAPLTIQKCFSMSAVLDVDEAPVTQIGEAGGQDVSRRAADTTPAGRDAGGNQDGLRDAAVGKPLR